VAGPRVENAGAGDDRAAELLAALDGIYDPEMPCSIVDLGLVYGARFDGGCAKIVLTYTAIGCPAREMLEDDVRERLLGVSGVHSVEIEVVWSPPWTKERLTARGRELLLASGYSL
jgi:metal-sulfur cluster biosynthetic enzyme